MMRTIWTVSGQARPNAGRPGQLRSGRDPIGSSSGSDWLLFASRTEDHRAEFDIVS